MEGVLLHKGRSRAARGGTVVQGQEQGRWRGCCFTKGEAGQLEGVLFYNRRSRAGGGSTVLQGREEQGRSRGTVSQEYHEQRRWRGYCFTKEEPSMWKGYCFTKRGAKQVKGVQFHKGNSSRRCVEGVLVYNG